MEITVFVRNLEKSAGTLEVAATLGAAVVLESFDGAAAKLAGYDVVISTLPPHGADALAAEFAAAGNDVAGALLLDVAYDPWPSALGQAWREPAELLWPESKCFCIKVLNKSSCFQRLEASANWTQCKSGTSSM
ncbi:hypothetical protein NHF46_12025 [Arthrobacter alpinus]|nr:hypothetical protein [Arthrobacter alpinus]